MTAPRTWGISRVAMYTKNGKQRRYLRGLAHPLKPVIQIGGRGLAESVLDEAEAQLHHHELIKIRVSDECPVDTAAVQDSIRDTLRGEVVQTIGRTLIVYRPRKKKPTIQLPDVS